MKSVTIFDLKPSTNLHQNQISQIHSNNTFIKTIVSTYSISCSYPKSGPSLMARILFSGNRLSFG